MPSLKAANRSGLVQICYALTLFFTTILLVAGAAAAAEKPTEQLYLKFHLRSFGMRIATLKFEIDVTPKTYLVKSRMKTKGLVDFIKGSRFIATAKGIRKKSALRPLQFDITTKNSKTGTRDQVIKWNAKRMPAVSRSWQIGDFKTATMAQAIKPKMPDPLTAMLTATLQSSKNLCRDQFRVINGKTVFDMLYSYVGNDRFSADHPGVYRGQAHRCQVLYRPVAGLSKKKLAKLRTKPNQGTDTFTIWMAPVKSDQLGRVLYVPVGGSATFDGRRVDAYLVAAVLSGKALNEHSLMAKK